MKKFFFLLLIFLILELTIRVTIPIYSERYIHQTANKTRINMFGINIFNKELKKNNTQVNIRDSKIKDNYENKDIIIDLIGDSVSKGYGLRYQDTFFSISESILNSMNYNLSIIPYAFSGTNLASNFEYFREFFNNDYGSKKKFLIYQFNYNDVVPQTSSTINWQGQNLNFLQRLIVYSGKFRYKYLNRSALLTFIQFNLGKIKYKKNATCEKRKNFSLGPYSYAYGAIGFEKEAEVEWKKLEKKIIEVNNFANKKNQKFIVLITPTILDFEYQGNSNPYNFDLSCATINANDKIQNILVANNIKFIDPTIYMRNVLNRYSLEKNPISPFFDLDSNHPNEIGSKLIGHHLAVNLIPYLKN